MYHRKSVSKLILLLSPIKCHFAVQCFSSSVILKRISIERKKNTHTHTNNYNTKNSHNVLGADEIGQKIPSIAIVCVIVIRVSVCVLDNKQQQKQQRRNSHPEFHCSSYEGLEREWMYICFYICALNDFCVFFSLSLPFILFLPFFFFTTY